MSTDRRLYHMVNVFGLIFALVLNFLAIALPLNGNDTRTLSDKYTNLFVPAPSTFAIWSIIYVGIIAFVIRGLLAFRNKEENVAKIYDEVGILFVLSCLCNGLWIVAWHYEIIWLSVIIMLALLYTLGRIYLILQSHRPMGIAEIMTILVPISIYFSWICVATIANISAFFISIQWGHLGIDPVLWTKIMITIAVGLGIFMVASRQDIPFILVTIWAVFGIYKRHYDSSNVGEVTVGSYALTMLMFMSLYSFLMLIGKKSYFFEPKK